MVKQSQDSLRGQEVTVHELFSTADRRLRAPEFQRHYVWRPSDQIRRLWDDFDSLADEGTVEGEQEDSLFLGALVVQPVEFGGGGRTPLFSVIDGQQRILTLYLVLTAIAEAFQDTGDFGATQDIESEYLLVRTGSFKNQPRVESTVSDMDQFATIMSCLKHPKPVLKGIVTDATEGNLTDAWEAIRRKVRELGSDDEGSLSTERLSALRNDIVDRIELVEVVLGSRHDPHQVYERLNTAGVPLKPIDLVRNEVFLTAGADADVTARVFREQWDPFESELGLEHQDAYFFPYTLIRRSSATKASAYRVLKQYWRDEVTKKQVGEGPAADIVRDLSEFVPAFRGIVGVSRPARIDDEAWLAVQRLSRMSAPPMMYPYLMQLIHHHTQDRNAVPAEDVVRIISVIDSFVVRRAFAGMGNAGVHTAFNNMWERVRHDSSALLQALGRRSVTFPDDDDFADNIRTATIANSNRCRYILTEYERSLDDWDQSVWHPDKITIDHVMPRNPTVGTWANVTPEDHKRLLDTWANLVPMTPEGNPAKGNIEYADARERILENQATVFKSTYKLYYENPTWLVEDIESRAEDLVSWALQRWPKSEV